MPYLPTHQELASISAHVSAPTIRIERDPRLLAPWEAAQNEMGELQHRGLATYQAYLAAVDEVRRAKEQLDAAEHAARRSRGDAAADRSVAEARANLAKMDGRLADLAPRLQRIMPDIRAAEGRLSALTPPR
jgi:small-conductance mechanosensitive channel